MQIEERWLEAFENAAPDVEEACSAWAAQVLAARCREYVTADGVDIDGQLPNGLAGINKEKNACLARNLANFGERIDESAISRDVSDSDQLDAIINRFA